MGLCEREKNPMRGATQNLIRKKKSDKNENIFELLCSQYVMNN